MKAIELRELNTNDLETKLNDLKQEHFNLRFQHGVNQLENTSSLKKVKTNIARIKTIIREKQQS